MTDAKHLDELLSTLRREMNALDVGDQDVRQRLDRLILDIEARVKNPDGVAADEGLGGPEGVDIEVRGLSSPPCRRHQRRRRQVERDGNLMLLGPDGTLPTAVHKIVTR